MLRPLGFQEGVAYDDRANTRLLGSVPVEKLGDLLGDLRLHSVAWSLIAGSPLNDLRREPGGADQLEALLLAWYDTPKGKELLLSMLDEWQRRPAGAAFLRQQPAILFSKIDERTNKPDLTLLHERLLGHIARHPDAADLLDKLLAAVVASPDAPALLEPLLNRLLSSGVAKTLPVFFRTLSPVVVVEARPDLPIPSSRPPAPPLPAELQKVGPELRGLLDKTDPARLEVILTRTPADGDRNWFVALKAAAPGLVVEGRLGPLVSVRAALNQVKAVAALSDVAAVRLPRAARPRLETAEAVAGMGSAPGQRRGEIAGHEPQGPRHARGRDRRRLQRLARPGRQAIARRSADDRSDARTQRRRASRTPNPGTARRSVMAFTWRWPCCGPRRRRRSCWSASTRPHRTCSRRSRGR